MTYAEKLLDPRWQRKRLEILSRDNFTCQFCGCTDRTLHVHHRYYVTGRMPWNYPSFCFQTLCKDCHDNQEIQEEQIRLSRPEHPYRDWEIGLDHFGDDLVDMAADEHFGIANPVSEYRKRHLHSLEERKTKPEDAIVR